MKFLLMILLLSSVACQPLVWRTQTSEQMRQEATYNVPDDKNQSQRGIWP